MRSSRTTVTAGLAPAGRRLHWLDTSTEGMAWIVLRLLSDSRWLPRLTSVVWTRHDEKGHCHDNY